MNNNAGNSSQSSDDDTLKKREIETKEFEQAADESYRGNEDLKNKIFLGCLGLAGMMISAAIVQLGDFAWKMYAAQTIMVMLFIFGLHALAVAMSITALSNPERPLPTLLKWILRWITRKKNKEYDPYTLYKFLIGIVKIIDMACLGIIAVWSLYVAFSIWGKFPLF